MIDPRVSVLDVTVGNHDFSIRQSPGVLQSSREGGTTGAAVWRLTPLLAAWLCSPSNILFKCGFLGPEAVAIELGSGIAGLVPAMLGAMIGRYIATDQQYAMKLLRENVIANTVALRGSNHRKKQRQPSSAVARNVDVLPLDWETDDVPSFLQASDIHYGVDLVLASDCVYNYALIEPFVQTCVDICRVRTQEQKPTICLVAQQLRQPDVFEEWLRKFHESFYTWRLSDKEVGSSLSPGSGFVVHVGVLRS